MAETTLAIANQELFITAQELAFVSGRLLLDRIGFDTLLEYTNALDMESQLQADPTLRDMSEMLVQNAALDVEKRIIGEYFANVSAEELPLSKRLMAAYGAVMLGADGCLRGPWGAVHQAKAEIEDDICVAFGQVDGYVLDHFTPSAVRLNSDSSQDTPISIVDLHDSGAPVFRIQHATELSTLMQASLADMLGEPEAAQFISAIDKRLSTTAAGF